MSDAPALRIALLMHSVRPRGGVVHTLELAAALQARGHRVTVIAAAEPGEQLFRRVAHAVALIRLPALSGDIVSQVRLRISTLVQDLPALLDASPFDLLHAQDSLSGNALTTLREQGRLATPWLRTVHHLDQFEQPLLNQWQARAWRHADGVGCVSDTWWAQLQQEHGCRAERLFNGVNLQRYRPAPDDSGHHSGHISDDIALHALGLRPGPICLLLGGVEARKNTVRLLHGFAQQRAQDPAWADAQLVVAGGASMLDHSAAHRAWAQALQALHLAEGPGQPVLRTGPLPDDLLPPLMRRASVLAMPSLAEGFGLAALEALACGTPVLVSDRPPFTEHLRGCASVAWCDPEDTSSIASGLQRAAQLPRLREPPPVCQQHSWGRSAQRHEDWYRRTLQVAVPREPVTID